MNLVLAVVGNSDLLSAQVKIRHRLLWNRIIMKIIIDECLSEMFKTSHVFCYMPYLQQKTAVRWCMSCMCHRKSGRSFYLSV